MKENTAKKPMPWLLVGGALLIPVFIVGIAFLAAVSDAKNKKEYDRQRAEIAKKFEQQKAEAQAAQNE